MTEAIAAWKESVGISVVKPWNILHVHTQANLLHKHKDTLVKKETETNRNKHEKGQPDSVF